MSAVTTESSQSLFKRMVANLSRVIPRAARPAEREAKSFHRLKPGQYIRTRTKGANITFLVMRTTTQAAYLQPLNDNFEPTTAEVRWTSPTWEESFGRVRRRKVASAKTYGEAHAETEAMMREDLGE